MFWILMSSIMASFGGILLYIYYWRKGQFDDPEDVKYQMFRGDMEDQQKQENDDKSKKFGEK